MLNWDDQVSLYRNLLSLKGVGKKTAKQICSTLGISLHSKKSDISSSKREDLSKLLTEIQKQKLAHTYVWKAQGQRRRLNEGFNLLEDNLDIFEKKNFLRLLRIKAYRAIRMKSGYPVRGQRTRSNARISRKLNRSRFS